MPGADRSSSRSVAYGAAELSSRWIQTRAPNWRAYLSASATSSRCDRSMCAIPPASSNHFTSSVA
ncbi:conserved hypothetical protein [Ricinus communis]|uniref:Uncharacterized protein n=1 Tax=Ricinus communis TaxID=3988 RepID=B9THL1_RICCO|nr:conserved hypothetical protein [Ricinus communis]